MVGAGKKGYKVYYFDVMARAESTRLLMWKWGVPYEDVRLNMDQWRKMKAEIAPQGHTGMPILELPDGTKLSQTAAINNYIATMAKLHPKDPKDVFKGEILFECFIRDGGKIWSPAGKLPADEPERSEAMREKKEVIWPTIIKAFERYMPDDKKFIAGDTMTTHDYTTGMFLINVFKNPKRHGKEFWDELWALAPQRMVTYVDDVQKEIRGFLDSDKRQERSF